MSVEKAFRNARIVLPDGVIEGSVKLVGDSIASVDEGGTTGEDFGGDFLIPAVLEAHRDGDEARLRSLYGYAETCLHHRDLSASDGVRLRFYRHILKPAFAGPAALEWITPEVAEICVPMWHEVVPFPEFAEAYRRVRAAGGLGWKLREHVAPT